MFPPAVSAASEVRAGVARATFELPRGVPLAGYSRRHGRPSRGVHDPVGVRALVITDAQTTVALVSCDLLIIDEHLFGEVRRRLLAQGLPEDLVLFLAATHTHSGPGGYGEQFLEKLSMGHFDPGVFDRLAAAMTEAVIRADHQRQPIRIGYGTTATQGLVVNRVDPHGLVDDRLIVTLFYPASVDMPLAVLVSFAAHPTTLGAWNRQLSADYPGVLMRELERRFPGTTAFFFAGAVGDQGPVKSGDRFERAEWVGQRLAAQASALIETVQPESPTQVQAEQEHMRLPPPHVRLGRVVLPRWVGARLVDDDATLSVAAVGRSLFIGVPCDLAASLGMRLKDVAAAQGVEPMIIGFANDYIGYCVSEPLYEAKQYESSMAFNGPKAGELVVDRLVQMIEQMKPSDK